MKIGIIVYSQTGNTYLVALKLQDKLVALGHKVTVEKIEVTGDEYPRKTPFEIKKTPSIKQYDAVIFGAPVEAFTLSPVMKEYLRKISSLKNKKVCCYVTEFFPYPWMGGNRAIKVMKVLCTEKNCDVKATAVVNWNNKKRDEMIRDLVDKISDVVNQ